MKLFQLYSIIMALIISFISHKVWGQSPGDAIMMHANQACFLIDYNYSNFDHYWEGTLKRDNQTIGRVRRHTVMSMVAIGISNRLNLFTSIPKIWTNSSNPNGGKFAGVNGFQDLSFAIKYRWLDKALTKGNIYSLATIGFSIPSSKYLSDYMPYSIGLGAPELMYRLIVQNERKNHFYFGGVGTFVWRGYTKAERIYYYNGGSYFTDWMDVPNSITGELILGKWLFNKSLQLDLKYFKQISLNGDDIRAYNAPQPTNRINLDRIGIFAHYYLKNLKGLGLIAYFNQVVKGRNAPELNTTGVGVSYFFNYKMKQRNENH